MVCANEGTVYRMTEYDLENELAALASDEGTNFGLPIVPLVDLELFALESSG